MPNCRPTPAEAELVAHTIRPLELTVTLPLNIDGAVLRLIEATSLRNGGSAWSTPNCPDSSEKVRRDRVVSRDRRVRKGALANKAARVCRAIRAGLGPMDRAESLARSASPVCRASLVRRANAANLACKANPARPDLRESPDLAVKRGRAARPVLWERLARAENKGLPARYRRSSRCCPG